MNSKESINSFPDPVKPALRREQMLAQGRADAFEYALVHREDVRTIQAEAQETEDLLADPVMADMPPGATPLVYREGYVAALREAVGHIIAMSNDKRS